MDSKIAFLSNKLLLEGRLWTSTSARELGIVLCHPHPLYGGNMSSNVIAGIAESLWIRDVTALRFNFRGTGESQGTHEDGRTELADVLAAVDRILQVPFVSRVAVVGYSFGAWVGLMAGVSDPRVSALVGIAPPVERRDFSAMHRCNKPTLFVAGDNDHVCPVPALHALTVQCLPTTSVKLIPGTDHFFLGRIKEITEIIATFLEL